MLDRSHNYTHTLSLFLSLSLSLSLSLLLSLTLSHSLHHAIVVVVVISLSSRKRRLGFIFGKKFWKMNLKKTMDMSIGFWMDSPERKMLIELDVNNLFDNDTIYLGILSLTNVATKARSNQENFQLMLDI